MTEEVTRVLGGFEGLSALEEISGVKFDDAQWGICTQKLAKNHFLEINDIEKVIIGIHS